MNNTKLNPLYNALDGIDEDIAARVAVKRRKINKPLKIAVISVAAAMLLSTTAAAATLGDAPIIKINNKQITPMISSYVDDLGWKVDTLAFELPNDLVSYKPVGEIRAVCDHDSKAVDTIKLYDELGIELNDFTRHMYIRTVVSKDGENTHTSRRIGIDEIMHFKEKGDFASGNINEDISLEIWQDPVQAIKEANEQKRYDRMSLDEKIDYFMMYGWDIGYPDYSGFQHPSMRDIIASSALGHYGNGNFIGYDGSPSTVAAEYYGYTLDKPYGFTEKDGLQVIMSFNIEEKYVDQQIFIYTMTDNASGKDVKFTVWRSAEEKNVNTDCFDFDYEYIPLNNGTEARLHQSGYSNYIVEFEKDGAAYAAVTDLDRELVERVLANMNLL